MDKVVEELGRYRFGCISCGGEVSDLRLLHKAPCSKCLPEPIFNNIVNSMKVYQLSYEELVKKYYEHAAFKGPGLRKIYEEIIKVEEFEEFFHKATRFKPWSSQVMWAKRLLKGRSFSIVSPTGTGKTVFALVYSLYLVSKDKTAKVLLVFPTRILLQQAYNKILRFADNVGLKVCSENDVEGRDCVKVVTTLDSSSSPGKETVIAEGKFNILLTTNMYMHRNYEKLLGKDWRLIVLDDVDSVLKSSKAIEALFRILGLTVEEIQQALRYVTERTYGRSNKEFLVSDEKINEIRRKIKTLVLVSSATGRPRGLHSKLFRVLLGFSVGTKGEAIRRIKDYYVKKLINGSVEETVYRVVKLLGDGGLIFVPVEYGKEYAERLKNYLNTREREAFGNNSNLSLKPMRFETFYSGKKPRDTIEPFVKGGIDVLIGVATYYGVMVRGIDYPERIKYTVFVGVPRHRFNLKSTQLSPMDIVRLLKVLNEVLDGEDKRVVETLYGKLMVRFRRLSSGALRVLEQKFMKKLAGEDVGEDVLVNLLTSALEVLRKFLSRSDVLGKIRSHGDIAYVKEGDQEFIMIPDVATYIQASGRCSRLYPGGITQGVSIIIVDDVRLLNGLAKKMKIIFDNFDIEELDFNKPSDIGKIRELMASINEERKLVKKIIEGEAPAETKLELAKTALLIVESPNKARTIAKFFGKPSVRVLDKGLTVYDVSSGKYVLSIIATMGHIYDLAVDTGWDNQGVIVENGSFIPVYTDIKRCIDCGYQFTNDDESLVCPRCGSSNVQRKINIVKALQDLASEVDVVLIGTDPDTEGEKIGWDIKVLLEPYAKSVKRIEFHEVTPRAILKALETIRDFKEGLVKAQIVRRVEDRWLGFSLSKILQMKLWSIVCYNLHQRSIDRVFAKRFKNWWRSISDTNNFLPLDDDLFKKLPPDCCEAYRNLSAGRVQTPVLKYVIDRFNEVRDRSKWSIGVEVDVNGEKIRLILPKETSQKIGFSKSIVKSIIGEKVKIVSAPKDVEVTGVDPPEPYTTETLLQDASSRLGLSVTEAMRLAQDLFECGLITYHRTDSTRVSDYGISIAQRYLEEILGENYRVYFNPKTYGEGGAHECIRPTGPVDPNRLRELIYEGIIYVPKPLTRKHFELYSLIFKRFIASQMKPAKVIKKTFIAKIGDFEVEFTRVIGVKEDGFLKVYKEYVPVFKDIPDGEYRINKVIIFKPPLVRFHDIVKWMKEQRIGRPSTYAKIIQTLIERGYVSKLTRGGETVLVPSMRGLIIYRELEKLFKRVIDVEKTRELELKMEEIEEKPEKYREVLAELFREVREDLKYELILRNELEYIRDVMEIYCGELR